VLAGTGAGASPEARQMLERHVEFAALLRDLGPGFDKVARIVHLHHRCYAEPRSRTVSDYPADAGLPRGDDIPCETRVLRAADVLDTLLTRRTALDLDAALATIRQETELGVFDPRVTAALEHLASTDRALLQRLYTPTDAGDRAELAVYFTDRRVTAGCLLTFLESLTRIYLPSGRLADRLTVSGVEVGRFEGGATVKVRLAGNRDDVRRAQEALQHRIQAAAPPVGALSQTMSQQGAPPVPHHVEALDSTGG